LEIPVHPVQETGNKPKTGSGDPCTKRLPEPWATSGRGGDGWRPKRSSGRKTTICRRWISGRWPKDRKDGRCANLDGPRAAGEIGRRRMAVMIERNERLRVAPDRNLTRNPTPRSYPTALEEMRGGQVVILPLADARMKHRIPAAERSCDDWTFGKKRNLGAGMLRSLKRELAKAAGAWREDRSSRRLQFTLRSGERGRAFRMRGTDMQPSRSSPHGPEPGRPADLRTGMVSRRKRSRRQEPEVDHRRKIARAF